MWWEAVKCAASGYQYIIMDLPLLFEAGIMVPYMHKIIVVTCEEDLQLQRLMEQRHLSERDAKLMIGAQMNLDQKEAMAQFVIENSGSLYDTTDQVSRIHSNLSKSYFHWKVRFLFGVTVGGLMGIVYYISKKVGSAYNTTDETDVHFFRLSDSAVNHPGPSTVTSGNLSL